MSLTIQSTSSDQSEKLIRIFLTNQRSGVLATADRSGNPHAAVVYYKLDDDMSVLFGTRSETQKFKNLEENKQAAFVVYDEATQTTVQITGRVEFVEDETTREHVLEMMHSSSVSQSAESVPPVGKLNAGDYKIVRIIPMVIRLAEYSVAEPGSGDIFETILFSE